MGMPGGWELVLVVGIVILLFGGKKIPELAKGLGKGIKDFKKAVKDDEEPAEAAKEIADKSNENTAQSAEIAEKKTQDA